MDLLGITEEEDSNGTESPILVDSDWSDSRYEPLGSVSGTQTVSVSGAHAGRPLYYVATNVGSSQRTVDVPYTSSLQSSGIVSTSSLNTVATPQLTSPRAIRGIPGQFDYPDLIPSDSGSGDIGASEIGVSQVWDKNDEEVFSTMDGDVSARVATTAADGQWSLYIWIDTSDDLVDTTMIDALSSRFMNSNSDADIFELVKDVFGDPWGPHPYDNLIESTRRDIHVLLYDIRGDGVPVSTAV